MFVIVQNQYEYNNLLNHINISHCFIGDATDEQPFVSKSETKSQYDPNLYLYSVSYALLWYSYDIVFINFAYAPINWAIFSILMFAFNV